MYPLDLINLQSLMDISIGSPKVHVGIIDGPVDIRHPAFQNSKIKSSKLFSSIECNNTLSIACIHGTFITGILCSRRDLLVRGICPDCNIILHPIFKEMIPEKTNLKLSRITPKELANAIIETIDVGAKVINLSLELKISSLIPDPELLESYDYARKNDVLIIAAAGNHHSIGNISLINHPWIIPVAACDRNGKISTLSNFGPSIGIGGIMAPGEHIISASPGGKYIEMSGTSVAAPFVTGTIALLWSIFPSATAADIKYALLYINSKRPRSIIPPLLNGQVVLKRLQYIIK